MKKLQILILLQVCWQLPVVCEMDTVFDTEPVDVKVIKGQPVMMPCKVFNKKNHQIIWMNPRRILISTADRRVIDDTRMSIERPMVEDWFLHIRNVQPYDDGEYTCQINTDPIQIKRVRLEVQVPAEIENATSSNDTIVEEGVTINLTCEATGIPKPTITWYRKTMDQRVKEPIGNIGEVLKIHNISRHCGGLYECEANNNIAQPVRRVIKVEVEFAPEVRFRTTKRMGQRRGRETLLECFVTAFPHGVSQWKKNGVQVPAQNAWKYKTDIYKEDHFTVALYLRIVNLEAEDFGQYTCEAENRLGRDSDRMFLYEYYDPTPPPTRPTHKAPTYRTQRPTGQFRGDSEIRAGSDPNYHQSGGYVGAGSSYSGNGSGSLFNRQTIFTFQILTTCLTLYSIYASCSHNGLMVKRELSEVENQTAF